MNLNEVGQFFYAPTLKEWRHLDLPFVVRPNIFNFVTNMEKWRHPCPKDKFLVLYFDIFMPHLDLPLFVREFIYCIASKLYQEWSQNFIEMLVSMCSCLLKVLFAVSFSNGWVTSLYLVEYLYKGRVEIRKMAVQLKDINKNILMFYFIQYFTICIHKLYTILLMETQNSMHLFTL